NAARAGGGIAAGPGNSAGPSGSPSIAVRSPLSGRRNRVHLQHDVREIRLAGIRRPRAVLGVDHPVGEAARYLRGRRGDRRLTRTRRALVKPDPDPTSDLEHERRVSDAAEDLGRVADRPRAYVEE